VGLAVAGWLWVRQQANRVRVDRMLLRLPGVGAIMTKFATTQFSRTLATLLGGGIPLVTALDVAGRAVANRYMGGVVADMVRQVREGQSLAAAMSARAVFPDVAIKMVEVGEATGALQDMLNAEADFFDEDIDTTLTRFVTIIEPLMLVIMGLVIAALLLALYLPVFQLSSAVA
jgi:type IV pilus assembly protein PilC